MRLRDLRELFHTDFEDRFGDKLIDLRDLREIFHADIADNFGLNR